MISLSGRRSTERPFFEDDGGFSTAGMAIAMLLTLSLLFTTAQVYGVQTRSAEVQNVADAAVLAAESTVAELYVVAAVCDAVVLSLTVSGVAVTGVGLAALCVPPLATLGAQLVDAGRAVFSARDSFVDKATRGLEAAQRSLPFLSAARALAVMRANSDERASYAGFVVLLPSEGEGTSFDGVVPSEAAFERISESEERIAEASREADAAAAEALRAKEAGFAADCGSVPDACMHERASSLAGLSDAENPLYGSVDAWSFAVGLDRARAYYAARAAQERPDGTTVADSARSALRSRFYDFACEELAVAYVVDTEESFDCSLPTLPSTPDEVAATRLQTEAVYPVTEVDGSATMHAWAGCPEAAGSERAGSIEELAAGEFATCELCRFDESSLGRVAAATTSVASGFEHHWRRFVEAAEAYERARGVSDPLKAEVRSLVEGSFEGFSDVLEGVATERVEISPPGRAGAIAIVADTTRVPADAAFESSFVTGGGALGMRVAVSGASLVEEGPDEGRDIISSLLDGLEGTVGPSAAGDAAGFVVGLWSAALGAYTEGFEAVRRGLESILSSLPLASASGLGPWASDALMSFVESAGLEPVEMGAPKPAVVNTAHVAAADDSSFAREYADAQKSAVGSSSTSLEGALSALGHVEVAAFDGDFRSESNVEIARVELLGDGGSGISIVLPVPSAAAFEESVLQSALEAVRGAVETATGVDEWR